MTKGLECIRGFTIATWGRTGEDSRRSCYGWYLYIFVPSHLSVPLYLPVSCLPVFCSFL